MKNKVIGLVLIVLGAFIGMILIGAVEDQTSGYISAGVVFLLFLIAGIAILATGNGKKDTDKDKSKEKSSAMNVFESIIGAIIVLALIVAAGFAVHDCIGCVRNDVIPAVKEFNDAPYVNSFSKQIAYKEIPPNGQIVNVKANIFASKSEPIKFYVQGMNNPILVRMYFENGDVSKWKAITKNNKVYSLEKGGTLQAKQEDCAKRSQEIRFMIMY